LSQRYENEKDFTLQGIKPLIIEPAACRPVTTSPEFPQVHCKWIPGMYYFIILCNRAKS